MYASNSRVYGSLTLDGPHDLDVLPEYPADRMFVHSKWINSGAVVVAFENHYAHTKIYLELERFLRHLVFDTTRWKPATNTSAMITLLPINGFRHRFWINGNLIGLKGDNDGADAFQEACVLVEHYPRFPTLLSLEEYIKSRLPYENMSRLEIQRVAEQINKRFLVVGRKLVREFSLIRKVKKIHRSRKKLIVICLRWELPLESWGHSTWKAYFQEDLQQQITFTSSRVSCHVDLRQWVYYKDVRMPWTYSILGKGLSPLVDHSKTTKRALTWLRICMDQTLKKPAVILSLEDDPVTGIPEDIPDGVSIDVLKVAFNLLAPELLAGTPISPKLT
jgi:hypothetical protein